MVVGLRPFSRVVTSCSIRGLRWLQRGNRECDWSRLPQCCPVTLILHRDQPSHREANPDSEPCRRDATEKSTAGDGEAEHGGANPTARSGVARVTVTPR